MGGLAVGQRVAAQLHDSGCVPHGLVTQVAFPVRVVVVVTMTSRQIIPVWHAVAEGPQAAAVQMVGHEIVELALTHFPHSAGPQQTSFAAQVLPPHGTPVPVFPPLPPLPPLPPPPPVPAPPASLPPVPTPPEPFIPPTAAPPNPLPPFPPRLTLPPLPPSIPPLLPLPPPAVPPAPPSPKSPPVPMAPPDATLPPVPGTTEPPLPGLAPLP